MEESPVLTPADWHSRYQLQAGWTSEIRQYAFTRASLADAHQILEVGCGSGVICSSLHERTQARVTGLDLDLPILRLAANLDITSQYINGDALKLPFADQMFNMVLCHYFLLWVQSPVAALKEMARVCQNKGTIFALAEPDYGGRIDHPNELVSLGQLQSESLKNQGADIQSGRKLANWFHQAGISHIEYGVLGGRWAGTLTDTFLASEWQMIEHDMVGCLPPDELTRFKRIDMAAWVDGTRVLYIPTFYAIGKVM
ncbi:MAG: methyltransferase domain-containing protein [Anaerolineaceae bacterium]|nr:methyltransferase domain-containing protein [Anaerolineaceae bacterium]